MILELITHLANAIKNIFKFHKLKIACLMGSALVFFVIIFPYDDLSDLVSSKVSELSNNQVFLQFNKMGLNFFPSPGLNLEEVELNLSQFPTLKAGEITLSPNILGLLAFKPGFVVRANDFLESELKLSYKTGDKIQDGVFRQNLDLEVNGLELSGLKDIMDLPIKPSGKADINSTLSIDPSFTDQPEGELQLNTGAFKLPATTVSVEQLTMSLPGFDWSKLNLKGRIVGGKFIIENADIGSSSDPVNGQVKGNLDVTFSSSRNGEFTPNFGAYDIKVKLNVSKSAAEGLSLYLGFLDGYKSNAPNGGSQYALRITGSRFGVTPSFQKLGTF